MDLMGAGGRRPVDIAVLEIVVAAVVPVGVRLVRGREAQRAVLPADRGVFAQDGAVHFVGARGGRPEDEPALEGVIATVLRRTRLVTGGEAEEAQLPAQVRVLAPDGPM